MHEVRRPMNRCKLRSFLGLTSYYRHFIKGFSNIASPLSQLTSEQAKWKWTVMEQSALDTLKSTLVPAPVLHYPDLGKPY